MTAATSATVGETTSAVSATTSALVEGGVVVVESTEQVGIVETSKS